MAGNPPRLIEIRSAGPAERAATLELRYEVFCDEQGVPREFERDEHDDDAQVIVAVDRGSGRIVGTCRLIDDGQGAWRLGRLAVARSWRGRGLGTALVHEAERVARARGATAIALHAQTSALGVYERNGFVARGEPFDEVGIEHLAMEKRLRGDDPPAPGS
jgi:putative N-acetyltransferase (TIGR04045 family)